MFLHGNLPVLIFALTLLGQVHTGKVIGGHKAVPHSRPYMALVERADDKSKMYCDGFLLNEDFVMTAAHCQAKSYKILLGVHNFFKQTDVQNLTAGQAFPHEKYNPTMYQYDIMLLKLTTMAKFTTSVKPIALAHKDDITLPTSCLVSGWGQTNREKNLNSHILKEVNVTLIYNKICNENNVYCSEGAHGPGMGDSGGPLVCNDGKAYGVVSASTQSRPYVYQYTKIPDNRKWIDHIMKHN
ncbi:granzyme B-like isoform X1 [Melanotaenia boesemani]|uniref:granzyme B-like isoform X1 n=1 Tax=Melanotaenia boesemani TaxID=1250792 RepID=UPI001C05A5DA|nr:granzyme B-like isoform X1 [Melanotaenia boesemani]